LRILIIVPEDFHSRLNNQIIPEKKGGENIMKNKYLCLKGDWTIRGTAEKWILFNFKKGLCEERRWLR